LGLLLNFFGVTSKTEIGEAKKLIGAGENLIALFLHLRVGGRRDDDDVDYSLFQRRESRGIGAQGENFEFFFRVEPDLLQHHARADVRSCAKTTNPQGLALKFLE